MPGFVGVRGGDGDGMTGAHTGFAKSLPNVFRADDADSHDDPSVVMAVIR